MLYAIMIVLHYDSITPLQYLHNTFITKYIYIEIQNNMLFIVNTYLTITRSHTCFNQLVLPAYSSYEILHDRMTYALENTSAGFYIE